MELVKKRKHKMKSHILVSVIFSFIVSGITGTVRDLANEKGTSGSQVVDHVIDIISQPCLLGNSLFLRRMAYVETRDGMDPSTYTAGYHGGIWKVDENMFRHTQNQSSLQSEYTLIKDKLFIDWSTLSWEDLRVPLKSGLAAALYVRSLGIRSLPDDIQVQATVWGSLKPNNQASTFFLEARNINIRCVLNEELDMVIAMDFAQVLPVDLARLQLFLETFLKSFRLSLNETRVGLVTKKLMPKAGWYLNSDRPGFTFLDALKALTYTPGPTYTGDMLEFIRTTMFNSTKGARPTAARAVLFLTDGITQYSYAKTEAENIAEAGISLYIIEVDVHGNSTSSDQLNRLTEWPGCDSVLVVRHFADLEKNSEEIKRSLCNVPAKLDAGIYTFPCSQMVHMQFPDPSSSYSIQVLTSSGAADMFVSKTYTRPDIAGHDAMLTSTVQSSPVLFIRGTDPVYISVEASNYTGNCSHNFEIVVKEGETFAGVIGTCFIGGVVRECNALDMSVAAHDIVLIRDSSAPSLCNIASHIMEYFPHPTDPKKFIMCDRNRNQYIGLCPVNQSNCVQFTSGCKYSNPCSPDAISNNVQNFGDPCGKAESYIRCSKFGVADVLRCGGNKFWNQDTKACVFKYVHNVLLGTEVSNITNPCLHNHEEHAYFPYPNEPAKYIFCDAAGNAFESRCHSGLWNQQTKACMVKTPQTIPVG